MNADEFWLIIDQVHADSGGEMDRKCALLKERLVVLDAAELGDFINHFDAADAAAYTWSLWGAAYVMHGGCSDDSFADFRSTLISQGREVFVRALKDPDSLADLEFEDEEAICYEGYQYAVHEAAEETFGEIPPRTVFRPAEPVGESWDEDSVGKSFPRLAAKYGASSEAPEIKKPWWRFW